jgi:ribosomal protein S25
MSTCHSNESTIVSSCRDRVASPVVGTCFTAASGKPLTAGSLAEKTLWLFYRGGPALALAALAAAPAAPAAPSAPLPKKEVKGTRSKPSAYTRVIQLYYPLEEAIITRNRRNLTTYNIVTNYVVVDRIAISLWIASTLHHPHS